MSTQDSKLKQWIKALVEVWDNSMSPDTQDVVVCELPRDKWQGSIPPLSATFAVFLAFPIILAVWLGVADQ